MGSDSKETCCSGKLLAAASGRVVLFKRPAHYKDGLAADEFVANRVRSGRKQP
jgi:hypothetical protein